MKMRRARTVAATQRGGKPLGELHSPMGIRVNVSGERESIYDRRGEGNWPSALALFIYAAAFSFAYNSLSAGTGALLLFGAVQATMILWGLRKGERLRAIQLIGLVVAVTGLVVLLLPGLSAPPLSGSILMLGPGCAS